MASEPRFYLLENEFLGPHHTHFSKAAGTETASAPRCAKCDGIVGMRIWLPPYRVEIEVRGEAGAGDYIKGPGFSLLVSERFADTFRKQGLTGFVGFDPVEVVKVTPAKARKRGVPRYFSVQASYSRAAVDERRSRIRRSEPISCEECRSTGISAVYGFRLEPGTWQGEDVFRPRGLESDIVVSERFERFVREHGFTNMKLTPTEQYVIDFVRKGPPSAVPLA
jgi:hypothetical protein